MSFLNDIRVVDATRLLPGGFCTMLLSDMGASVVKVEQPGLGDYMRSTPPTVEGVSPVHSTVNRNKLSIGVNLKSKQGKLILHRLVRSADVFVEGFRPGAMERLGFSFDDVRRTNRRIIYCSISAFGQRESISSTPGHDINFQAIAGTLGYPGKAQVPLLQLSDLVSGTYAALAIVGAIAGRKRGVHIDVPIAPSLLSWTVLPASSYFVTGRSPKRGESLIFGSTPYYNVYATSDGGHVAVAAIEQEFWHNLLSVVGAPELEELRFGTQKERRRVSKRLAEIFASKTRDQWAELLEGKETCSSPVASVGEALESAWAQRTGVLARIPGDGRVLDWPVHVRPGRRKKRQTSAPTLGRDTGAILSSLGYGPAEVERLKRVGAVE